MYKVGWAKLNYAYYHRRQFKPGRWVRTRPLLRYVRVETLVDSLTGPNFCKVKKSVTGVSAMSPVMLVIAFNFSPLNFNQTCFFGRIYGGLTLHVVYSYLLIEVRCIKSKYCNDILQTFG